MDKKKNRAIFLDRDGTINKDKKYLFRVHDFEFLPGVIPALRKAQEAGYLLIIITNQSGIARGYYGIEEFEKLNLWMLKELKKKGVIINGVYYCPHHPEAIVPQFRKNCECRKPKTGMFKKAAIENNLDLNLCFAIGDRIRDCSICEETNCHGFLIGTTESMETIKNVKKGMKKNVEYVEDLTVAIKKILENQQDMTANENKITD